ncbi:MAG: hypothetical protein MK033_01755 [Candidatus Caenarcaniphilales bacterium]|nr:hypothetical protein [Candidatus Caenarcaniphilales bacterium]
MSGPLEPLELVRTIVDTVLKTASAFAINMRAKLVNLKNNLGQRLDYYKYVASQYLEFYGRKENQELLKRNLKDYSQSMIEKQKYKFQQKKENIIDRYKYEKYKFLRRLDESREEISHKASKFKDDAQRALESIS